jgi:hypothetical protein
MMDFFFFFFSFGGGTGVEPQGFTLFRQALYRLSHSSRPRFLLLIMEYPSDKNFLG